MKSILRLISCLVSCLILIALPIFGQEAPKEMESPAVDSGDRTRLQGKWRKADGLSLRAALNDGDIQSARHAIRRMAEASDTEGSVEVRESRLIVEMLAGGGSQGRRKEQIKLARRVLESQSGSDQHAMFMRGLILQDHLHEVAKAEKAFERVLRGYVGRWTDISSTGSLLKAVEKAGGLENATPLVQGSFRRLSKIRAMTEEPALATGERKVLVEKLEVKQGEGITLGPVDPALLE